MNSTISFRKYAFSSGGLAIIGFILIVNLMMTFAFIAEDQFLDKLVIYAILFSLIVIYATAHQYLYYIEIDKK